MACVVVIVVDTGATPAKNTADAAGALRNALTACNTLVYTWHTLHYYPHGANAGCDLAGVAPVVVDKFQAISIADVNVDWTYESYFTT